MKAGVAWRYDSKSSRALSASRAASPNAGDSAVGDLLEFGGAGQGAAGLGAGDGVGEVFEQGFAAGEQGAQAPERDVQGFLGAPALLSGIPDVLEARIELRHDVVGDRLQLRFQSGALGIPPDDFGIGPPSLIVVVADLGAGRGYAVLEGGDVLLNVLDPLLEVAYDAFLFVGVLQELLDLDLDGFLAPLVLLDLGLGLGAALGKELGFLLLAVLLHGQAVDLLLVVDQSLFHGVDHVHVLFQGTVDRIDLVLDLVAFPGVGLEVLGAPVALGVELLQAQELDVQLVLEDFVAQRAVFEGLVGLDLEGIVGSLDLPEDALDLLHVLFCLLKFSLGLRAAHLVARDAGCLLE